MKIHAKSGASYAILPSFKFTGAEPTDENIRDCQTLGFISPAVTARATAPEGWRGMAEDGPWKAWRNMGNKADGAYFLDGGVHRADTITNQEMGGYSLAVRRWYDARPAVLMPNLRIQDISKKEWERISFNTTGIEDPSEYPFGEVRYEANKQDFPWLPMDCVTFMLDGLPCVTRLSEAERIFPLSWSMPTVSDPNAGKTVTVAGGVSVAQAAAIIKQVAYNLSTRQQVDKLVKAGVKDEDLVKAFTV